ncbi:SH3 domain-containing protein [Thiolapillus sp.]|uniref:SH3 domain-containing protein n=1 Tax=Thiolapillus sp. TaxID=2017437 RepID=UPI003AF9CE8D
MNGNILSESTLSDMAKNMNGIARGLMPNTLSQTLAMMEQFEDAMNPLARYISPDPYEQMRETMGSLYRVETILQEMERHTNHLKNLLPETAQTSFAQLYRDAMRSIEGTETRRVGLVLDAVLVDEHMSVELETNPQGGLVHQSLEFFSSYFGLEWIEKWFALYKINPLVACVFLFMLYWYSSSDMAEKTALEINININSPTVDIHHPNIYYHVRRQAVERIGSHSPVLEMLGFVATKRDALMVRASPNSRGKVVGRLPQGSIVTILERCEEGRCPWWLVRYSDQSDGSTLVGWVYSRYIRPLG